MRVLLLPPELALLFARIPLDLRHRRLAELLGLTVRVPLLHDSFGADGCAGRSRWALGADTPEEKRFHAR